MKADNKTIVSQTSLGELPQDLSVANRHRFHHVWVPKNRSTSLQSCQVLLGRESLFPSFEMLWGELRTENGEDGGS